MPATIPQCEKGKCCGRDLYREITVRTWDDLRDLYYCREGRNWTRRWVFRGQTSSRWCVTSTLERTLRKRFRRPLTEAQKWENRLLRQFKRNAPRFLSQPPQEQRPHGVVSSYAALWRTSKTLRLDVLLLGCLILRDRKRRGRRNLCIVGSRPGLVAAPFQEKQT